MNTIKQNSIGDFECPVCKAAYLTRSQAEECLAAHNDKDASLQETVAIADALCAADQYKQLLDSGDSLKAGSDLIQDMIQDYMVSRKQDLLTKGKVSSLTLQLAKNAAAALNDYNKLVFGEKKTSVGVSVKAGDKDGMSAFKDLLSGTRSAKKINDAQEIMPEVHDDSE